MNSRLLVVTHDAGGAEVIAAWAARHAPPDFTCVAEGPARRVFSGSSFRSMRSLARADALDRLADFDAVLTGTSWGSELERLFLERAVPLGIHTTTYLDHWTDYRERFTLRGRLILPREIWVCDSYAEKIAREAFPGHDVRNVGNLYLEEISRQVRDASVAIPRSAGKRVLFVSEPLSTAARLKYGDANYYGYTEHQALSAFLEYAARNWAQTVEAIRIRRHPSEAPGKFAPLVDASPALPVVECGDAPLVEDCAWADWIAGCQSMALVVGLLAGKKVFSAIPSGGRMSAIPYPGIVSLFDQQPHELSQGLTS